MMKARSLLLQTTLAGAAVLLAASAQATVLPGSGIEPKQLVEPSGGECSTDCRGS